MKSYSYRIRQMRPDELRFYEELLATHAWQEILPIPRGLGELQVSPGPMQDQFSGEIHRRQPEIPTIPQGGHGIAQATWPTAQEGVSHGQRDAATHQSKPRARPRPTLPFSKSSEMTQEERDRVGKHPPPIDRYKNLDIPGLLPVENQPCLPCVR